MKRALLLLAALALFQPRTAKADCDGCVHWKTRDTDRLGWYVPDFARLQTGGYTGMLNIGIGYAAFNDILNWSVGYGFTPKFSAGRNVHSLDTTLSIRPLDFRFRQFRLVPIYFGGGLLFGFGDGYFIATPSRYKQYSKRYYVPTAVHWFAHVGAELDFVPKAGFFERHGVFVELRTLDTFFFSSLDNKVIGFSDVISTAFGYRAAF